MDVSDNHYPNQDLIHHVKSLKRILIVDDDDDIVKMIKYQLQSEGYQTISAQDGLDALEKVAETKPHLIILDIMMPKVDGWVVCHSIKGNVTTKNTRVIILSALNNFMAKVKGMYILQADLYMTKPFELEDLSHNIQKMLNIEDEARASTPTTLK